MNTDANLNINIAIIKESNEFSKSSYKGIIIPHTYAERVKARQKYRDKYKIAL
jgi:hypothetical protein